MCIFDAITISFEGDKQFVNRKSNHTLLVHIGTGKTGSTSIQGFLAKNRSCLIRYGWSYPDICKELTGIEGNYKNGEFWCSSSFPHSRERDDILTDIIERSLKNYNTIISEEDIWDCINNNITTDKILSFFVRSFRRIKVVVYLRRQDLFLESMWNESVKSSGEWHSVSEFIESSQYTRNSLEYLNKLKAIEKLIGKDNLIVRVFEKKQFKGEKGDVVSDFLDIIGSIDKTLDEDAFIFPERVNESLSPYALSVALLFNKVYREKLYNFSRAGAEEFFSLKMYKWFNELSELNAGDYSSAMIGAKYLTKEERSDLLLRYENDNSIIARIYLKREDGKLFSENNEDYPMWYPFEFDDKEKGLIRAWAGYVADLQGRLFDKEYENNTSVLKCTKMLLHALVGKIKKACK